MSLDDNVKEAMHDTLIHAMASAILGDGYPEIVRQVHDRMRRDLFASIASSPIPDEQKRRARGAIDAALAPYVPIFTPDPKGN